MKKLSVEEVRQEQVKVLKAVKEYCDKNDIKYFLSHGTLLGAIRHDGFIPWDDDIDICMLREDYQTFIEHFNAPENPYQVYCCENDPKYCYPFAKISEKNTIFRENTNGLMPEMGINIDCFPIDYIVLENESDQRVVRKIRRMKKVRDFRGIRHKNRGVIKETLLSVIHFVLSFFNLNKMARKINQLAAENTQKCKTDPNAKAWCYEDKTFLPRDSFDTYLMHTFEQEDYKIPVQYDQLLRLEYGDYMELPPVEKRVAHHDFTAYGE